ncbi:siderophore-iron reductase FhuF [Ancylobacter polymorphus]|uniref:Siderophore-iron reductase FhuF n=1 Tax=Ancylobacter polymorphus TaxID=223390 RepID=A0A9E7D6E2_9HYPH|nr:siderophore-iron reductase FhuF [Ancylobacter polymorphus]UOK73567.1 siderophore-iron reductase FhuF [Ancylobacter polymorphus]
MIEPLAPLFPGALEEFGDALIVYDGRAALEPLDALLRSDRLAAELARFGERYEQPEPRAVASQWSKLYFSRLLVPATAAAIAADWHLPLAPRGMRVALDAQGGVATFALPHAGTASAPGDTEERFGFLVTEHLPPVIDSLARASGLTRRVIWSNAGNLFERVIGHCAQLLGEAHPGVQQGRELLARRRFANGAANPLAEPVRYLADGTRQRRVCCLRYLIPTLPYCGTCPLDRDPMVRNDS